MPATLLRPYALSAKNRLLVRASRAKNLTQDLLISGICLVIMFSVYSGLSSFLLHVGRNPAQPQDIAPKIVALALLAFFVLLLFSNLIACLSFFFSARDLPLLLSLPISSFRLFFARLLIAMINSSWVILLFGLPALMAIDTALGLAWWFVPLSCVVMLPFLLIPTAFSSVFAVLFVNLVPVNRIREVVGVFVVLVCFGAYYVVQQIPFALSSQEEQIQSIVATISAFNNPSPVWLPSRWTSELIGHLMGFPSADPLWHMLLLVGTAAGLLCLGYLAFDLLFMRGWTLSLRGNRGPRVRRAGLLDLSTRWAFPLVPQFRGLFLKEWRMFVRDTTQIVQLMLLLMLTFVYLYNFKVLRSVALSSSETHAWWQTILCVANISLGGCVIAAISTRFVYPAISLEGQAYWIVRCAPLDIKSLLLNKFWIWLMPTSLVALVLLVAGAWAINVTPAAVFLSGVIGIALSVGIVGLGIGIGSVYAQFDWESPTQVSASFGSLVFMLLAIAVVMVSLLPASVLIMLSSVPGVATALSRLDYLITISCASFLAFFINFCAARWALGAGYQALKAMEK